MQYVDKTTRQVPKKNNPKCIKNWLWTIKAVQEIWKILQKAQFQSLNLKFLNQDILENFFGQIRNFSNRNPIPKQFEEAFKALLVCNLTSKQSFVSNCKEEDEETSLVLSELINLDLERAKPFEEVEETDFIEPAIPHATTTEITINPKRIIKIVKDNKIIAECQECTHNLIYNNTQLIQFIQHAVEKIEKTFSDICYEIKVAEKVIKILENGELLPCLSQCAHLQTVLFATISYEFIKTWCAFINKILCRKTEINDSDNYIYNAAKRMSKKYMKKRSENKDEK